MNFWKTLTYRWDETELKKWTSFRRTVYILFPLLVYFVAHDAAEIVLWALAEVIISSSGKKIFSFFSENAYTLQSLINAFAALIGAAAVFPAVRNELSAKEKKENEFSAKEKKENELSAEEKMGKELSQGKKKGKPEKKNRSGKAGVNADMVTAYGFLAAFAFCISLSLNIFFYQTGFTGSSQSYDKVYELQYGVQFAIGLLLYGIISPLAEEAIFRGLIYNRMKRCFGCGIALVFSAVLFGAYHGNLVQAVYGSILGLLIAYFYELFQDFTAPVLFHGIANISVYVVTYRGNLELISRGIALITGTIMLAASILLFFYLKKKLSTEEKTL